MPTTIHCDDIILSDKAIADLWFYAISYTNHLDDDVGISCVDESEIQKLNKKYRKINETTNILTFSYNEGAHDIAICMAVAKLEAKKRNIEISDYVALLLTHSFLHACGFDHELSKKEKIYMEKAEQEILTKAGYMENSL